MDLFMMLFYDFLWMCVWIFLWIFMFCYFMIFLCTKAFMDVLLFQGSSFGIKMFMVRMDLYRFYES